MSKSRILLATILLSCSAASMAGDAAAGKAKAVTCGACHGADGNAPAHFPLYPNLAGQKEGYLIKQLKAFRGGERKDPVMAPMAMALSDTDIENLAAYFASL